MRICQVRTGVYDISRANNYGAIERIIYNYQVELQKLGHQCDVKYLDEIKPGEYDIVHTHFANLTQLAIERGLNPVFTMHDHHSMIHDNIKEENKKALQNAVLGIVPGEHLLPLFGNFPNVKYLPHGVDQTFFIFKDYNIKNGHKLLCVANNGILGDETFDRKGFRYAIEAAELLDLPITVAGPRKNNEIFFNANPDLLNYKKLNVIYDLNEQQLLDLYHSHTLFLHPSSLEAGNPNLTLLEAFSCGLPVIGTYEGSLPLHGMKIINRNTLSLVNGIQEVINNYDQYVENTKIDAQNFSWKNIVKKLENLYKGIPKLKIAPYKIEESIQKIWNTDINMREQLIDIYSNLNKNEKNTRTQINVNYNDGAFVEILGSGDKEFNVEFYDENSLVHQEKITPNHWCKPSKKWFTNWKIKINEQEYNLDLNGKNVLIINESPSLGDSIAWAPYIDEFRKLHNCNITYATVWIELFEKNYPEIKFIPYSSPRDGYYALYKIGIFHGDQESIERHPINWKRMPLQKVVCDQLGLEYKEIRPKIVVHDIGKPIKERYVVISEWSTLRAKLWLYPNAWQEIVDYLNKLGYKVIVVSKEKTNLKNIIDRTNRPIHDTINTIFHADFSMTMSSGVGWIAWALGKKNIVPSGFSENWAEYRNTERVMVYDRCNSCFNDETIKFDRSWDACPRNNQYICSTSITPQMVKNMIDEIMNHY